MTQSARNGDRKIPRFVHRDCSVKGCAEPAMPPRKMCYRHHADVRNQGVRNRRLKLHTAVRQYLEEHPCCDCGEKDPIVLQFDHRDPDDKHHAVSDMISRGRSKKAVFAEIDKCDVRCANCHARRTAKQLGYYQ